MSSWSLVACLVALRTEFDRCSPRRDKGADGSIGDTAHLAKGTSDHLPDEDTPALRLKDPDSVNEVHALDIDSTGPWPGGPAWFDAQVMDIVDRHRQGVDNRLEYVIWNHRIASREHGWVWRPYTGSSDPHVNHAHFSARYDTKAETDTRPWGVYEEDSMPLNDADKKWLSAEIAAQVAKVPAGVWLYRLDNPQIADDPKNPGADDKSAGTWLQFAPSYGRVDNVGAQVSALAAAVSQLAGKDLVDEQAIVAGILAGLTPEQAGALPEATAQRVVELLTARLAA